MRMRLLSIITVLFMIFVGAGQLAAQKAEPENAEITIMGWDQMSTTYLDKAAAPFIKAHPNVKLNRLDLASGDAINKVIVGMSSGVGCPDIFICDPDWQPKMVALNGLLDITPVVGPVKNNILPDLLHMITVNGKIIRVPMAYNPIFFYYRKDIFDQYGVSAPKDWTVDFMRIADKVTKDKNASGEPNHYLGDINDWQVEFWMIGRQELYNNKDGSPNLDTPVKAEVLKWIKEVVDKKYMRFGTFLSPEAWELMKNNVDVAQSAPFWEVGFGLKRMGYKPELEGKWRTALWPAWKPGESYPGGSHGSGGWAVWAKTKYPKLCMELLSWFLTDSAAKEMAIGRVLGPATKSGTAALADQGDPFFGGQKIWKLISDSGSIVNNFSYDKNHSVFSAALSAAVHNVVEKGMAPEEALKQAQAQALNDMK